MSRVDAPARSATSSRRALTRWSLRLFRREWRQLALTVSLLVVAVGATVVGLTVARDSANPADVSFGSAQYLATLGGRGSTLAQEIADIHQAVGRVDVIENETVRVPGSVSTFDLRAQDVHGSFGGPLLQLVSGRYPSTGTQVAVTPQVAQWLGLHVGSTLHVDGAGYRVVGLVQDPQDFTDEFALVVPGAVTSPTETTVLFDATPRVAARLGSVVESKSQVANSNAAPQLIISIGATLGLLLVGLVSIASFTVVAQRRLRSFGMLGAIGATARQLRWVVILNGLLVGLLGAAGGLVLGLVAWAVYRPSLVTSAHHDIGFWTLPVRLVVAVALVAVVVSTLAATWPARALGRASVVRALSGRPESPKSSHRMFVAALVVLGLGVVLLVWAGASAARAGSSSTQQETILGLILIVVGVVLIAPSVMAGIGSLGRLFKVAPRVALRDLGRFRTRSGAALAAITLATMVAVLVAVLSDARYSNPLDWIGQNLSANQMVVYSVGQNPGGGCVEPACVPVLPTKPPSMRTQSTDAHRIAALVGASSVVTLYQTSATLSHEGPGRNFTGPFYVATPQLLRHFGINPDAVPRDVDVLTARPGLAGLSGMLLDSGVGSSKGGPGSNPIGPCPASECVANPVIVQDSRLPSGTSAPNTVLTEAAVARLHLAPTLTVIGWLLSGPNAFTSSSVLAASRAAGADQLSVESSGSFPSLTSILDWATLLGILVTLAILAMTIGLIRVEAAPELRMLTANGASSWTRRAITASTALAMAVAGAVIGTAAAYMVSVAFLNSASQGGGLDSVPVVPLVGVLVGMPLIALVGGWLFAGREPSVISRQPIE